jgi:uncharacterized membrane protein YfcA
MSDQSFAQIILIIMTFFFAGVVKGVTGMGLPTVAMGVLGTMLSPLTAAALLLVPSLVTNAWQLVAGPRLGGLVRRLWPMLLTIIIGTLMGSMLLATGDSEVTTIALGVVLVVYAAYTLLARPSSIPSAWEPWLSPAIGLITGLVTGATGVFVIPAVPYIQSLVLERDEFVQALGLSFTVSTIALGVGLLSHNGVPSGNLLLSTLAVVPALLGMAAGQAIRTRISPQLFRRIILIFLLLLGVEMALHAVIKMSQ